MLHTYVWWVDVTHTCMVSSERYAYVLQRWVDVTLNDAFYRVQWVSKGTPKDPIRLPVKTDLSYHSACAWRHNSLSVALKRLDTPGKCSAILQGSQL